MSKTLHLFVTLSVLVALAHADTVVDVETPTTTPKTTTTLKLKTTTTLKLKTTTTLKLKTTTIPSVITTVKPSLPEQPPVGNWNVTDKSDKFICVLLNAGIRFTFQYVNAKNVSVTRQIDLPATNKTAPSSECGKTDTLAVNFFPTGNTSWQFRLDFAKTAEKSPQFYISTISLSVHIDQTRFPDVAGSLVGRNVTVSKVNESLYKNDVNMSYQCDSQKNVTDFQTTLASFSLLSLETVDLKLEAFRVANTTTFSAPNPCPEDVAISNIVPIAVGAALAGLVVIVLIAYLIGRRRTKRGYESV